jgi:hypothetical protein
MEKEKIFKGHDERKDLAGEHACGDLGQIIFHEETLLIEKFGDDYEQYKSETPMLLPRLLRRKKL